MAAFPLATAFEGFLHGVGERRKQVRLAMAGSDRTIWAGWPDLILKNVVFVYEFM